MKTELLHTLKKLVGGIVTGKMQIEMIKSQVREELDSKQIWDVENLLITDCYYALKHIEEERISPREWEYFMSV